MKQLVDSRHPNRRRRRLSLAIVWTIVAIGLWWCWPLQPRLTIKDGDDYLLAGITPDSQQLFAFTQRAIPSPDKETGEIHFYSKPSGQIQVWNLRSGDHRVIPIPGISSTGMLVSPFREKMRMLEPNGWHIGGARGWIRGKWFQFDLLRDENADKEEKAAIVDLDNGEVRFLKLHDRAWLKLSRTGRWYIERLLGPERRKCVQIEIVETATGQRRILIEGSAVEGCLSNDDSLFAGSVNDVDGHRTTRIWNMNTGEVVRTFDHYIHSPVFSNSSQLLAGMIETNRPDEPPRELRVWDISTGNVVSRWQPHDETLSALYSHFLRSWSIQFSEDDTCIYLLSWPDGLGDDRMFLERAWNRATDLVLTNQDGLFYDPNICPIAIRGESPSPLYALWGEEHYRSLWRISSNHPVYSFPDNVIPIRLKSDGTTCIVQQVQRTAFGGFCDILENRGILIPAVLQSIAPASSTTWSFIEIPSGRVLATIPRQGETCWLSPDEKTLVTLQWTGPHTQVINVWDFPPRRSLFKPLAWSLLAPVIMIVWSRWRRWRLGAKSAIAVTPK